MRTKEVKVAIIDNSIDSSIYNSLDHWKVYLDVEWDSFEATKSHFPDLKKGYTHLILTGSEASIMERENWVYEEVEIVQDAVEKGLSILGSCYGHQLLAIALVGNSCVQRSAHPEVGWIQIQLDQENELLGNEKSFFSFSIHFDEIASLSNAFNIFASSKECKIQTFQLKERPIWGIQSHPEISIPEAKKLLKKLISMDYKTTLLFEKALNSSPRDSGLIRQLVKNFLIPREIK